MHSAISRVFVLHYSVKCASCASLTLWVSVISLPRENERRGMLSKGPPFGVSSDMSENGNLLAFEAAFTSFIHWPLVPWILLKPLLMSLSFICLPVCCFCDSRACMENNNRVQLAQTRAHTHTFSWYFFPFCWELDVSSEYCIWKENTVNINHAVDNGAIVC